MYWIKSVMLIAVMITTIFSGISLAQAPQIIGHSLNGEVNIPYPRPVKGEDLKDRLWNDALKSQDGQFQETYLQQSDGVLLDAENVNHKGSTLLTGVYESRVEGDYAYCISMRGFQIIDISNIAYPHSISNIYMPDEGKAIDVSGDYAYVATRDSGLHVINISDIYNPVKVGSYNNSGTYLDLCVQGNYVYLTSYSGLLIINITTPENPLLESNLDSWIYRGKVFVDGNYAYVCNTYFSIIDISDPAQPFLVSQYNMVNSCSGLYVNNNIAYMVDRYYNGSDYYSDLLIFNVSNPDTAMFIGSYGRYGYFNDVFVKNSYAYVIDQDYGLRVFNVSNPVQPFLTGNYNWPWAAWSVFVTDSYAYVSDYINGIRIIDNSNPSNPTEAGWYFTGQPKDVFVEGNYAYVANNGYGLTIVDIIDPNNPQAIAFRPISDYALRITVSGNYAFLISQNHGLEIFDITDPVNPLWRTRFNTSGDAKDVFILDNYAYVADYNGGVKIINIDNPVNPVLTGSYAASEAYGVYVDDNYAYVANGNSGMIILDVSNPYNPLFIGSMDTVSFSQKVYVSGDYAFIAGGSSGIKIVDVSDPFSPTLIGSYQASAADIYVAGFYAYAARYRLNILDVTDLENPTEVGSYSPLNTYGLFVENNYAFIAEYHSLGILEFTGSEATGAIDEVVSESNNGSPIEGATVAAVFNGLDIESVESDSFGQFSIAGLPPRAYNLTVSVSGYNDGLEYDIPVYENDTTYINIQLDVDSGLVGYWSFNEGTGNIAYDHSGNGYNGIIYGTEWTPGICGSALDYDGVDDYVNCGDIFNNVTVPFTISGWIYKTDLHGAAIFSSDNQYDYWGFFLGVADSIVMVHYFDGGGWPGPSNRRSKVSSPDFPVRLNTWSHVAGVVNGPTDMTIYVNGVDAGGTYSGSGSTMQHNSQPATIGFYSQNSPQYPDDIIDEVRVYNRALSEDEIFALYQLSCPPYLNWSLEDGFINRGVMPDTGTTLTEFEYRIIYSDPSNNPPDPGYPKVRIDLNGNGFIDSLTESSYSMWPINADSIYNDGKEYFFRTYLPEGSNIQYAFEAINNNGVPAEGIVEVIDWTPGPFVSNQMNDLEIHVSDLSFSNTHPDPGEMITISASVANNSPTALNNVLAYLYIGNNLIDSSTASVVNVGYSEDVFQFQRSFPQDYFYSVRVVLDPHNATNDWNILNNAASRGLLVGDYVFSGGIDLNVDCPDTCITSQYVPLSIEAHYFGMVFSDSLPVSGATVTIQVIGFPSKTAYTNDYGILNTWFIAPQNTGLYTLEVTITDYTLTRTERCEIIIEPPPSDKLAISPVNIDHCSLLLTNQPFRTTSTICPSAIASNRTDSTIYDIPYRIYLDGGLIGSSGLIPFLPPFGTYEISGEQIPIPSDIGLHNLTIRLDPDNNIGDHFTYNNVTSDNFNVWPDTELVAISSYYRPRNPNVYDTLTFNFTVKNNGFFDLDNVTASFINNDNGDTLGYDNTSTISNLGGLHTFSMEVEPFNQDCHTIKMVVDPFNEISEYSEANNYQYLTVCVDSLLPDFSISARDFGLTNPNLTAPGHDSVFAIVRNIGNESADSVVVRFYEDGSQIGTDQILSLQPGVIDTALIYYYIDFNCHDLSVVVDPDDLYRERNEQNNTAAGKVPAEIWVEHIPACPDLFVDVPMFSQCWPCVINDLTVNVNVSAIVHNSGLMRSLPFTVLLTDQSDDIDSILYEDVILEPYNGRRELESTITFDTSDVGTHMFTVSANSDTAFAECNSLNNYYSKSINIDSCYIRPDLIVDINIDGRCFALSETTVYDFTVCNRGTEDSDPTTVEVYYEGNLIRTDSVGSLQPDSCVIIAENVPLAFENIGAYYLGARVDPLNNVAELNESNNISQIPVTVVPDSADFVLASISFSDNTPDTTQVVGITATVRNDGGTNLDGDLIVEFYFDGYDSTIVDTISQLDYCNGDATVSTEFVFEIVGENWVYVNVDPANLHNEYSEENNYDSLRLFAHPIRPDLVITPNDINYSDPDPEEGEEVYVDITVHNNGNIEVPLTNIKIFMDGTQLGEELPISLAANGSVVARSTERWTVDRSIPQTIYAVVDSANLIAEHDESNNSAEICAVPNLIFRAVSVCPVWYDPEHIFSRCPAVVGRPLSIKSYIQNTGAMNIESELWIKYYDVFSNDTTLIDSLSITSLNDHGGNAVRSIQKTFNYSQIGTHVALVSLDSEESIVECDENNIMSYPFTVVDSTADIKYYDLFTRSEFVDISNVHPEVGEMVSIYATIYNNGPDSVYDVGVRFTVDEEQFGEDILIAQLSGNSNEINYSTISASMLWEANNLPTPLHIVRVIIDPNEALNETDEDNNEATRAIVVGDIPDLAVSLYENIWEDSCIELGDTIAFTLLIENRGLIDASADLIAKQVITGGDTVLLDIRPVFLQSLSNDFEDYTVQVEQDSLYYIFEYQNIYPEDYILDNNILIVAWENSCGGCDYIVGDVNGSNSYNGLDITYGVAYFKGEPAPLCPDCPLDDCNSWHYCGDVNGSCSYNGLDIIYGVAYLKGGPALFSCPDCPQVGVAIAFRTKEISPSYNNEMQTHKPLIIKSNELGVEQRNPNKKNW